MRNLIKRLYEADDIQQMPAPAQPAEMTPPAPVATSAEMMPDFSFQDEPAQEQPALPQADVMNLTVQELLDRCDKINPLVCMGLNQFIEANRDAILNQTTGEAPEETGEISLDDTDINFSKQVEPQAPEFSLNQPAEELNFPQA